MLVVGSLGSGVLVPRQCALAVNLIAAKHVANDQGLFHRYRIGIHDERVAFGALLRVTLDLEVLNGTELGEVLPQRIVRDILLQQPRCGK